MTLDAEANQRRIDASWNRLALRLREGEDARDRQGQGSQVLPFLAVGVVALIAVGLVLVVTRGIDLRGEAKIVSAVGSGANALQLVVPTCGGSPVVERVEEDTSEVRVTVVSTRHLGGHGQDCRDVVELSLTAALGDRGLVDAVSGRAVKVTP